MLAPFSALDTHLVLILNISVRVLWDQKHTTKLARNVHITLLSSDLWGSDNIFCKAEHHRVKICLCSLVYDYQD